MLLLKNLLFTLVVPGTVAVYLPVFIARRASALFRLDIASTLGLILIAAGVAGYLWCLWAFTTVGLGTPAPVDAPKRLVAQGPYRYVRNPMYVAVVMTIVGWSLVFLLPFLLLYAAAVAAALHLLVVFYEEPVLLRRFGDSYEEYCNLVNRWVPWA